VEAVLNNSNRADPIAPPLGMPEVA
jgi:hypothetical protein